VSPTGGGGPRPEGGRLSPFQAALALVVVAAAFRLYDLGGPSLTVDEGVSAFTCWLAGRDALGIPALMRDLGEVHPPGWFVALHFWARAGHSEAWLRLSSVLAGILAAPVTLWLGVETAPRRPWPNRGALAAALLVSTSAWHIQYSRELRMYPLLGLLILVHLAAFLHYTRCGGRPWLVVSCLAGGAAPWVHYFGLFGPLLSGLWMVRNRRDRALAWATVAVGAGALFAPWWPWLRAQFGAQDLELRGGPGWLALPELFGRMTSADLLPSGAPIYLALSLVPLVFLVVALKSRKARDPLLWLTLPPVLAWAVSQFTPLRVFEFKYFVWCAPFLALVQGQTLDPPGRWTRSILWALLGLQLTAWALLVFHPAAANQDWRAVAAEILREAPPDAAILVQPSMMAAPLLYYGVPPARMTPVDLPDQKNLQVLVGRSNVWLVTTPYHPLVVRTRLEEALDRVLRRQRGRQRPDDGAWLPSACVRVVRYRGEQPPRAEVWPRSAPLSGPCGLPGCRGPERHPYGGTEIASHHRQ